MGRPRKPEPGSQKWAINELKLAEKRLRDVRRLLEVAGDGDLPGLLRLEAALRREVERLAKLAAPQVITEPWDAALAELEGWEGDSDE